MSKIRVYQLARDLKVSSKEMVAFLSDLGADVTSHMSTIEDDIAEMVREHFENEKQVTGNSKRTATPKHQGKWHKQETKAPESAGETTQKAGVADGQAARNRQAATEEKKKVEIPEVITVQELANKLGLKPANLIKRLMNAGVMASINQAVEHKVAVLVAEQLGFEVYEPQEEDGDGLIIEETVDLEKQQPRPPVVTILGHVDHGKTSLLDAIRATHLAENEEGGITQRIGAYQVEYKGRLVTFLDTPGHEAFTAMRSRGVQVTDVAVLVIGADDGVMPQTVEAINHAKAADVPIIVAINKIDLPGVNPEQVKQQLTEYELIPEEWGGDTICIPVSALRKQGIDELLEMILLVADMDELKADPTRSARGVVIEAELDKGRGTVATVLIQNGTLHVGDSMVVGATSGKVRAMSDFRGRRLTEAGPSVPVQVLGLSEVPEVGEVLNVVAGEKMARSIAAERQERRRTDDLQMMGRVTLSDFMTRVKEGKVKDLNLIIKADVKGSVEALRASLEKLSTDEVRVNVIHSGVGGISETDVNLAVASKAVVIGFNVRPDTTARKAAERENVELRLYRVIYEAIDDIQAAMEGMLEPELKEVILGRAEVRATFKVPNIGTVAGCYVTEGRVARNAEVRILRDNVVIQEDRVDSLKRYQDDAREVMQGYECGIGLEKFNDIKEGDILEVYRMQPEQ